MTNWYSKLTRAISMVKASFTHTANLFLEYRTVAVSILTYPLSDNGPQFGSDFFKLVCRYLGFNHLTATTYHSHINRRVEIFSRTIVTHLRHRVAEHRQDWGLYVQPFSHAYNTQVHRSTNSTPYTLVLSRYLPRPFFIHATSSTMDIPTITTLQQMRHQINARLAMFRTADITRMQKSKAQYKSDYSRRVCETQLFQVCNYVFVDKPPLVITLVSSADTLASDTYNKLKRRTSRLYRISYVWADTVTLHVCGVPNTIFIDCVSHAPNANTKHRRDKTPCEAKPTIDKKTPKKPG